VTKAEAKAIRERHFNGGRVTALELQEAVFTLSKRRNRRVVLPKLPEHVQAAADALLCFNLGRALGKKS
jgi:hypothetical protein